VFIKIDQVRALRKQLRYAPLEGKRRVIIINDAQAMNAESANALLKVLEEPPEGTVVVLTALRTTDLLPTIVSRCQQVAFRPIPSEKIADVLITRAGLDRQTAATLAILAKGSLGKALSADVDKWIPWRRHILESIGSISAESVRGLFAFADGLARDKDRLDDALAMISIWFGDILMSKVYPERIVNMDFVEEIERASMEHSVNQILEKLHAVFSAQMAIFKNSNPRLTLEVLMMRLGQSHRDVHAGGAAPSAGSCAGGRVH
jgi:DNA polymerase-3 subunit delta'